MNIYCLGLNESLMSADKIRASDIRFAYFSALGTWSKGKGLCKSCQASGQDYIEPLLVQWEPSSDVIGDFSWDGPYGYTFVITEPIVDFFRHHNFVCKFLNVEYVEPEKSVMRWKCVPFPYTGPKQFWGECETFVNLDLEASNVELREDCQECGEKRYTFRYENIVIPRSNWHGEKMFRITTNGKSAATFVTEEGRRLIEEANFNNIVFRPAGTILD